MCVNEHHDERRYESGEQKREDEPAGHLLPARRLGRRFMLPTKILERLVETFEPCLIDARPQRNPFIQP